MKKFTGLAIAAVVTAAVATVRAQDAKPQDPALEQRIQKLLEQKKQDQEQAKKDEAKYGAETPEQQVARAKLLADSEHDYEKALALSSRVAHEEKNAADVRAQSLVIAARCLTQLGKANEARIQLQMAAQLGGPAADEARRLLDAGQTDQQLELRIENAIYELFSSAPADNVNPANLESNQTARDLIWVGAPAVPRIAKWLDDFNDLARVTGAAYLLGCIGNAEAATAIREALQRQDPLYRRAVLRGFERMLPKKSHAEFWAGPVRDAATSLLKDRDARVRESMLKDHSILMTASEILAMTCDPDDDVRIAAWRAMLDRPGGEPIAQPEELVAALRRCLKEDRDPVRVVAAAILALDVVRRYADGRDLAFESMLDPVLTGPVVQGFPGWMSSYGVNEAQQTMLQRPLPIDLLVRVAERFDREARSSAPSAPRADTLSRNALRCWIRNSASAHVGESDHHGWPASDRAKVWSLVRLGYGTDFTAWINENAEREDLPAIVDAAIEAMDAVTIGSVLLNKTTAPTDEMRTPITRSILRVLEADRAGLDPSDKFRVERVRRWCSALTWIATDEGDEALIRIAAESGSSDRSIAEELFRRDSHPVGVRNLAALATLEATKSGWVFEKRNDVLGRLAAVKSPELPKILAKCYALGLDMGRNDPHGPAIAQRGFMWLVTRAGESKSSDASSRQSGVQPRSGPTAARSARSTGDIVWDPVYPETAVREAFEACARVPTSTFWDDVNTAIVALPSNGPFDAVATAVLETALRFVASAPTRGPEPHPIVTALVERRAPGWEEFVVANATDSRWQHVILKGLPEVTPTLLDRACAVHDYYGNQLRAELVSRLPSQKDPAIRARAPEFLKDEDQGVRSSAIYATLAIVPEQALDLVLPLAKDPSYSVRIDLCRRLGTVFDRRVIPVLVELLKDPNDNVRGQAKTSLDALQYTFEQEQKWKRVLEGAGLDSANAAEALVKQAAAGQPKATRLVAIESLGTLGVAETLPVLIQFMGDGDAEVAAAAKEAVARINRQSKAGKDAKPPSDH